MTSAWRWSEPSNRAASAARPGTSLGWATTCPAVSIVRRTASMPRCAGVDDRVRVPSTAASPGASSVARRLVARLRLGVALEVDHRERELQAADAVGDRVMDLLQHRGAPAGEALDDRELPQRARPVERLLGERAAQVEQRAVVAGRGHRDDAHVRVEIERRIVGELRRHDAQRRADRRAGPGGGSRRARAASSARRRSSVGRRSRNVRLQKSERSAGSFSTAHMIASAFDIRTEGTLRPSDTTRQRFSALARESPPSSGCPRCPGSRRPKASRNPK